MELTWKVIEALGGVAAIAAFIWFISRETIKTLLAKDLEEHKSKLSKEANKEIEAIKAKNEIVFADYKEKLTHLSKRRIDAIEGVSQKIIACWANLEPICAQMKWSTGKPRHIEAQEEWTALTKSANELLLYFISVEIFFPAKLSDQILDFRKKLSVLIDVYASQLGSKFVQQEYVMKMNEEIRRERDAKIKDLYESIRIELRKLIGVEE